MKHVKYFISPTNVQPYILLSLERAMHKGSFGFSGFSEHQNSTTINLDGRVSPIITFASSDAALFVQERKISPISAEKI